MMGGPWIALLYVIAGVCFYATAQHAITALRRPMPASHLSFSMLALLVGLATTTQAILYGVTTPEALVTLRKLEITIGALEFAALVWFAETYLERNRHRMALFLTAWAAAVICANLLSPYSLSFNGLPEIRQQTLPWGGVGSDVREHRVGGWQHIMWLGFFLSILHGIFAAVMERGRNRRRAILIGTAYVLMLVGMLSTMFALQRIANVPRLGVLVFLLFILGMSHALSDEFIRTERLMRRLLDEVPAVAYVKDRAGRFLWVNRGFESLFGTQARSAIGSTDARFVTPEQVERLRHNDQQVLDQVEPFRYEESLTTPEGERTYVSLKFPILDDSGKAIALGGVSIDVEDQKRTEQELKLLRNHAWHADRVTRLGGLSNSIAHELNQPLAAILFNSQAALRMIANDTLDKAENATIYEEIARDSKRAGGVIAGMRSMVRKQQTPRTRVDIATLVEEALALLHSEITYRSIEVSTHLVPQALVEVDRAQIQQVVINLVMNALEAMPQPPAQLRVLVAQQGADAIRVSVLDSGEGVTDAQMEKLFAPFNSSKSEGLGMGLSICRSIVEAHGGSIRAERNHDRGMTFWFSLPLADESDTDPVAGLA